MRQIVMGGDALTEGFALLGFESFTNPTPDTVERVIGELLRNGEKALVYLEAGVAPANSKALARVRREGGRIVITEVPAVGAASLAVITEKPEMLGRTLIYLGLAEGVAIYGLVVTILLLAKI